MIYQKRLVADDSQALYALVQEMLDESFDTSNVPEGVDNSVYGLKLERYTEAIIACYQQAQCDERRAFFQKVAALLTEQFGESCVPEYKDSEWLDERANIYDDCYCGKVAAWDIKGKKIIKLRESAYGICLGVFDYETEYGQSGYRTHNPEDLKNLVTAILDRQFDGTDVKDRYKDYGHGAFSVLYENYCDEEDCMFSFDDERYYIPSRSKDIYEALIQLYGVPVLSKVSDHEEMPGDDSCLSVWEIDGKKLCLLEYSEFGDGDYIDVLLLFSTDFKEYLLLDDYDLDEIEQSKEPERPDNVPVEAVWDPDDHEWGLGSYNEYGNMIGEWKWWLAPKGYLCCHTFFEGEDGDKFAFTRYHADGTPSRIGRYVDGEAVGDVIWIRSDNPTIEQYPPNAGADVWKTVSTVRHGYTIEERYYDKDGNEVQEAYIAECEATPLMEHMGLLERFLIDKFWEQAQKQAECILDDDLAPDDQTLMVALYGKAKALFMQHNSMTPDILSLADRIIAAKTFIIFDFIEAFDINKKALRFAYYCKAWDAMQQEQYHQAKELTDRLFEYDDIHGEDTDMPRYIQFRQALYSHL